MRKTILLLGMAMAAAPALAAGTTKFEVEMTGAAEVPGPGADKGMGTASLTLDPAKGQICYMLHANGTDAATAAHIHKGAKGVAGPPVVMLKAPANGMVQDCVAVAADVMTAIAATPSDYYVNVHTATYPKGAMRGQLQ